MKNYCYLSFLCNDSYLPGVLVLYSSLIRTKSAYSFLLLITKNVSSQARATLSKYEIPTLQVEDIPNPVSKKTRHRWFESYTKLNIFNQDQYDKIMYLDADMLVCANLDALFEKPSWSAVNSGGNLPELRNWTELNAGLLVVTPSKKLFTDMYAKMGTLKVNDISDQDFIHAYYPDWSKKKELHLDHRYNVFARHLDRYHSLLGYTFPSLGEKYVQVVHYIFPKPWKIRRLKYLFYLKWLFQGKPLRVKAYQLWYQLYDSCLRKVTQ